MARICVVVESVICGSLFFFVLIKNIWRNHNAAIPSNITMMVNVTYRLRDKPLTYLLHGAESFLRS